MKTHQRPVYSAQNPRFILTVGAYSEAFPDVPADLPVSIYDRALRCVAVTVSETHAQAICLERAETDGVSGLCAWLNSITPEDFASEGIAS